MKIIKTTLLVLVVFLFFEQNVLFSQTQSHTVTVGVLGQHDGIADVLIASGSDAGAELNTIIDDIDLVSGIIAGGTIIILEGCYNVSTTIEPKENITIQGQGRSTTFTGSSSLTTGILIKTNSKGSDNIILRDFHFIFPNNSAITAIKLETSSGGSTEEKFLRDIKIENITIDADGGWLDTECFIGDGSQNLETGSVGIHLNAVANSANAGILNTNIQNVLIKNCETGILLEESNANSFINSNIFQDINIDYFLHGIKFDSPTGGGTFRANIFTNVWFQDRTTSAQSDQFAFKNIDGRENIISNSKIWDSNKEEQYEISANAEDIFIWGPDINGRIVENNTVEKHCVFIGEGFANIGNSLIRGIQDPQLKLGFNRKVDGSAIIDMNNQFNIPADSNNPPFNFRIQRDDTGTYFRNFDESSMFFNIDQGAHEVEINENGLFVENCLTVQGELHAIGSFTCPSDVKLKKEIKSFTTGLNALMQVNPITFKYSDIITENPSRKVGISAQQLQSVDESLVGTFLADDGEEYLKINPQDLIFVLINSVQEQQTEINNLKDRLKKLEQN